MASSIEFEDIQGLVRFGYKHLTEACYFLVKVNDPSAARRWLGGAPVTSAVELEQPPKTALQVAFTSDGLGALGVPAAVISGFSAEFISGMVGDENRSRRLGDTGTNSPSQWQWGYSGKAPHAVLMLFAQPGLLESWKQSIKGPSWDTAFKEVICLPTSDMQGREPFGFIDGISQPEIDWDQTRTVPINGLERKYGNLLSTGEFVLGYRNEYGRYTDRPLLDPHDHGASELPDAEDQSQKKDLGRNGTYLIMRQLDQDVRGFWQFVDRAAHSNADERLRIASCIVGRAFADGSPLVPLSSDPIAGVDGKPESVSQNQFTYDSDPYGTACPLGAHIRRANPRNADVPGAPKGVLSTLVRILGFGGKNIRGDLVASARFHRILRRGREYGSPLTADQALEPGSPEDAERGLHFFAINGSIQRQFEFVQNAWMMRTKFDGLTEESDPLIGNRAPVAGCPFSDAFSIPKKGAVRRRLMDVPQFVTVRGGAYFFMPGLQALRYLSTEREGLTGR